MLVSRDDDSTILRGQLVEGPGGGSPRPVVNDNELNRTVVLAQD